MSDSDPANAPEPDEEPQEESTSDTSKTAAQEYRLSPALIATLVTIPVVVIIAFIVFAAIKTREAAQIPIDGYSTSTEAQEKCGPFIAQLPETFKGYGGKSVDGNTVRWEPSNGESGDPVVLRCGVARPEGLAPTSALQVINSAQWFLTETEEGRGQAWVLVDRRPYVAMWIPYGAGNAPLTQVSNLAEDLTPMPLDFGN